MAQIVDKLDTKKKRYGSIIFSLIAVLIYCLMYKLENLGNIGVATTLVLNPAIIIVVTQAKSICKIANNKFVVWLGKISFSIYLWNIPIAIWVYFFHELAGESVIASKRFFWLHIAFSIALAEVTHRFFEKPVFRFLTSKNREDKVMV